MYSQLPLLFWQNIQIAIQHLLKWRNSFFVVKKQFPNRDSLERPVVIMRLSLHDVHPGPRHTADGPIPVVSNPHVEVPCIEVFEILIQWHKVLPKKWWKYYKLNWVPLKSFTTSLFVMQEHFRLRRQLYRINWYGKHWKGINSLGYF